MCTAAAGVRVVTHGKRKGRAVLKMQSGKAVERLTFTCKPARHAGGSATFATIQQKVFDATCATPTCHGAAAAAGGLSLAAGAAYGNLVGVTAANPGHHKVSRTEVGSRRGFGTHQRDTRPDQHRNQGANHRPA